MTKLCIMQPTFLPYAGYFQLIQEVDIFVYFDNVQFSKKSWQQRNKVAYDGKDHWITLPIVKKGLISETKVGDTRKLEKTLSLNYNYSLLKPTNYLSDINIANINCIKNKLGIKTRTIRSSEIGKTNIVDICTWLNATEYITTGGTRNIPQLEAIFNTLNNNGITVEFRDFDPDYSLICYLDNKEYLSSRCLSMGEK